MRLTTPNFSRDSHPAIIRVFDESGNVIETHEHNAFAAWHGRFLYEEHPLGRVTTAIRVESLSDGQLLRTRRR
jgi:hypothetical protein